MMMLFASSYNRTNSRIVVIYISFLPFNRSKSLAYEGNLLHVRKVADSTERVYLGTYCDKCQNEKEAVLNQSLPILQNQKFLDKHTKF